MSGETACPQMGGALLPRSPRAKETHGGFPWLKEHPSINSPWEAVSAPRPGSLCPLPWSLPSHRPARAGDPWQGLLAGPVMASDSCWG